MSAASAVVAAAVATAAYGVSDEWHQSFVPLRDASIRDWLTDLLGGATGAAGYGIITTLNAETARPQSDLTDPNETLCVPCVLCVQRRDELSTL